MTPNQILAGAVAVAALVLGFTAYDEFVAEKFELRKDEWTCIKPHSRTDIPYKAIRPGPTVPDDCDAFERHSG